MKIALFADNIVGEEITRYLLQNYPSDLSIVITIDNNNIYELATKKNVPTITYDLLINDISIFPEDIDIGFLIWWPKIIKKNLIKKTKQGFINTHPSLLPYNRGKHYNFWALVEQVPFGVTLHLVDEGIDTGDIVVQKIIPYGWEDNGETLYLKAQAGIIDLFCGFYPKIRNKNIHSTAQNSDQGTFHLSNELESASKIDINKSYIACDLLNLLRARTFNGYPGCWFEDGGEKYEISINIKKVQK